MTSPDDMIITNMCIAIPMVVFGVFVILWMVGGCMGSWERKHNQCLTDDNNSKK